MDLPDFYAILGVAEDAGPDELRRAYRTQARACHPDVNPDDAVATARFLDVAAAYQVLHDPGRRAEYDRKRWFARASRAQAAEVAASVPDPIFGAGRRQAPRRGDDARRTLDIPRSLARHGGRLTLDLGVGGPCPDCGGVGGLLRACWMCDGRGAILQPAGPAMVAVACPACHGQGLGRAACPACRGTGRHDMPRRINLVIGPGLADGAELRAPGAGLPGTGGAPSGDMIFTVRLLDAPNHHHDER